MEEQETLTRIREPDALPDTGRNEPPRGRDAVVEALIASATRLFAERGIDGASVREIAADAGVNHALVFRHFGSKARLAREVLDRLLDELLDAFASTGTAPEGLATVGEQVARREALWKLLTRALLDGEVDFVASRRFPELERLAGALARTRAASDGPEVDPRLLLVIVLAGSLGWVLLDPILATTVGAPGDTPERRRALAREAFMALMGHVAPGGEVLGEREVRQVAEARSTPCADPREGPLRPVAERERPHGRDEVVQALVGTARELMARRNPAAVSVREIAAAAGVNHALLFRHFGSKEGLVRAVWQCLVEDLAGRVVEVPDYSALTALTEDFAEEEITWRLLARALLEGEAETIGSYRYPFMEVLVQAVARDQEAGRLRAPVHPRLLVAMISALGFGWLLFHPVLLPLVGFEEELGADQRRRLREAVMEIVGWRRSAAGP